MLTQIDGIMAERFAEGSPRVIALHGWMRSRLDWAPVLEGLPAVAYDLPGFGLAPPPTEAWGTREYADYLAPTATEPTILVGHSFGGRVALQWAAHHPSTITGLVLTGVPLLRDLLPTPAQPARLYRLIRFLHRRGLIGEGMMEKARRHFGSADYNAVTGVMRDILVRVVAEDYTDELRIVASRGIPVEMVWGSDDTAAPVEMAQRACELLGDVAQLHVVEQAPHIIGDALARQLRSSIETLLEAQK